MTNLLSIAEQAWKQVFPNPSDETPITRGQFIATAKTEYAYQMWLLSKREKREEGYWLLPSRLLTTKDVEIKNNKIDISGFDDILLSVGDEWLQNMGGLNCVGKFMKSNVNHFQLMGDEDGLGDGVNLYVITKEAILFPNKIKDQKTPIIYLNNGQGLDANKVEIDDVLGAVIRRSLIEIYAGKIGAEDPTNDSNSGKQ